MPIVTAYDTLGEEGLKHSILQTRASTIFLDPHLLPILLGPLKEAESIRNVIYNDVGNVNQADIDKLKAQHDHLTIMSFEELRRRGETTPAEAVPPKPEDLCCIMYTSGSTGPPKGVPLTHRNVIAAIAGVNAIIGQHIGPGDALLTYLPLAHILEFVFENAVLYWGGVMGYGNPRTLSDSSVRNCKGDIREFRPTILVGVPAVWETVRKGIITKVNQSSPVVRNMFWAAIKAKELIMWTGLPGAGVLDAVVFKKVKEATGGRLRICMNGGGPIAKETQRFISMAITPMIGGYGLTETCAMGALTDPLEWTDDALGDIPACIEIKLVDFPDAGYYATNAQPQGEIWIRGPPVISGYHENEQETREALTPDGWFKTGDIGEWDRNGHLKIIDRKKNLVKTLNGEYIALEKVFSISLLYLSRSFYMFLDHPEASLLIHASRSQLESIYRSADFVANICVYAQSDKAKPIAIIVPAEPALKKLAAEAGIQGQGLEDLVHNEKLQATVLRELQTAGRKGGLAGIEIIEGVVLADEEWNPQNGLTTSAQKINRRGILEKYKKGVERAYSSSG